MLPASWLQCSCTKLVLEPVLWWEQLVNLHKGQAMQQTQVPAIHVPKVCPGTHSSENVIFKISCIGSLFTVNFFFVNFYNLIPL